MVGAKLINTGMHGGLRPRPAIDETERHPAGDLLALARPGRKTMLATCPGSSPAFAEPALCALPCPRRQPAELGIDLRSRVCGTGALRPACHPPRASCGGRRRLRSRACGTGALRPPSPGLAAACALCDLGSTAWHQPSPPLPGASTPCGLEAIHGQSSGLHGGLGRSLTPPATLQADRDYSGLWPRTTAPFRVRTWTLWVASGPAGAALEVQNAQNVLVMVELLLGDLPPPS